MNRLAVQITVVLSIDHLCFHLVVDAHVSPHWLLVILELLLDLLSGHHSRSFAEVLVGVCAVLTVSELVLHEERLLLLQVEVLHRLIILPVATLACIIGSATAMGLLYTLALCVALHAGSLGSLSHLLLRLYNMAALIVVTLHLLQLSHLCLDRKLALFNLLDHRRVILLLGILELRVHLAVPLFIFFHILLNPLQLLV